jgi:hypothetical protein
MWAAAVHPERQQKRGGRKQKMCVSTRRHTIAMARRDSRKEIGVLLTWGLQPPARPLSSLIHRQIPRAGIAAGAAILTDRLLHRDMEPWPLCRASP